MENPLEWGLLKQLYIGGPIMIVSVGLVSYSLKIIFGYNYFFDLFPQFVIVYIPALLGGLIFEGLLKYLNIIE